MNKKVKQTSNETFWPMFWSYVFGINSISCIVYIIGIFEEWVNTPLSYSLLLATLGYSSFVYASLSATVILLSISRKKGLENLDKIKDHGIIWYLGIFYIWPLVIAIVMSLIITGITAIFDYTTIYSFIELSFSILLYLGPAFLLLGFISGAILGLIYEFAKEVA